jgi:predicted RNA binding protein YcfA (HicA-like mRNA interferase family)
VSQVDKLVRKLHARPPDAGFEDVRKVLEHYGWQLARNESSHATFVKAVERDIFTVPKVHGKMVKRTCLDKICNLIGMDD